MKCNIGEIREGKKCVSFWEDFSPPNQPELIMDKNQIMAKTFERKRYLLNSGLVQASLDKSDYITVKDVKKCKAKKKVCILGEEYGNEFGVNKGSLSELVKAEHIPSDAKIYYIKDKIKPLNLVHKDKLYIIGPGLVDFTPKN